MENKQPITMDSIMGASFGETSNTIRATFKKTVLVRPYETEVVELESVLDVGDKQLTGAERMLMSATLQAQIEFTGYCSLACKGYVTQEELNQRAKELTHGVSVIKAKAEQVLGKTLDDIIDNKS